MEFEVHQERNMERMRCQYLSMEPVASKRVPSRHKRSNSCPVKKLDEDELGNFLQDLNDLKLEMGKVKDLSVLKKKQSPPAELQSSLKRELHLEQQTEFKLYKEQMALSSNRNAANFYLQLCSYKVHPIHQCRQMHPFDKFSVSASYSWSAAMSDQILQLERHLQDQISVRWALEKALGHRSSCHDTSSNEYSVPKPAKELIKEIAVLELEVTYLEQYLLSLYRRAFDQQMPSFSPSNVDERSKSTTKSKAKLFLESRRLDITPRTENPVARSGRMFSSRVPIIGSGEDFRDTGIIEKIKKPSIQRSQSSLTQCSVCSNRISHPKKNPVETTRGHHSQPLSLMEEAENVDLNVISLAEHLGARISDHVPETPNRLSEDMIRCMGAIYCKLAEPEHHGLSSSPTSFLSSSAFSAQDQCDVWSTHSKKEPPDDICLENLFRIESDQEFSGPYSTMVEVPRFSRGQKKRTDVQHMLQNYRLLVQRLEKVDPTKMKNEEKLAFWINIHNAVVMHVLILFSWLKTELITYCLSFIQAVYNVGGQIISAVAIQNSILCCRTHRPGQWLRSFFPSRMKFNLGVGWQAYAIKSREPLLHFALCGGSYSDPAVRVYTAKRVLLELEAAKEEYIQANVNMRKEQKIVLPKMIEAFAKDSNLSPMDVVDSIQHHLTKTTRRYHKGKSRKSIEWVPHNFSFRYLLPKELAN